jgi:hypothetical protein
MLHYTSEREGSHECAVLFLYQLQVLLERRLVTIPVSFIFLLCPKRRCLGVKETEVSSAGKRLKCADTALSKDMSVSFCVAHDHTGPISIIKISR